jgi:O-antigen/teichoic acid export membrane protein
LGSLAFAHVAAQGLAFIVSIAVTRTLGVEPYGVFVFGFAFPSWFVILVSLGLDSVMTVDVAADRRRASEYLTAVAATRIPLLLIAVLALWTSLQFLLVDPFARTVVFVLGIANLVSVYNGTFDSVFRAHERMDVSASIMVAERAISAGTVLVLLALGQGLLAVSLCYLLSVLLATALSLVLLKRRFTWFARSPDLRVVRRVLRRALPFALATLVGAFMYSTGPVLLTLFRGPTATGHFNAAFVLVLALMAPLQIYNQVFLPRMSRLHHGSPAALASALRRTQRLCFAFGLPIALAGSLYAEPLVVGLYGEAFRDSAAVFSVLVFVLVVATASIGAGAALAATDRAYLALRFGVFGALLNVVLCLLFIPPLGPLGAAVAILVALGVMDAFMVSATNRLIAPYAIVDTTARSAGAGGVMLLALFALARPPLLAAIALGAAIYFGTLLAVRGMTREDIGILLEVARGAFIPKERLRLGDLAKAFRSFAEKDNGGRSTLHETFARRMANDPEVLKITGGARQGQPIPFLFFAAVHYLLLKGSTHELAEFYPDLAPNPRTGDPYPAFRSFCLEHASELQHLIASRLVQTNEPQRSASLLPAFEHVARRADRRPLALVEIGSSAGLNLLWDRYSYTYGEGRECGEPTSRVRLACKLVGPAVPPLPSDMPEVAFRRGIDLNPVDHVDPDATLWLRSLLEPEQTMAHARLREALALARANPPTIVRGDAVEVLPGVLRAAPADAVLCIFHSFALAQFTPESRQRVLDEIARAGAKRDLFLISIEYSWEVDRTRIVVTEFKAASSRTAVLGYTDSRGTWVEWVATDGGLEAPFGTGAG